QMRALGIRRLRQIAAFAPEIGGALEQPSLRGGVGRAETTKRRIVEPILEVLEQDERFHSDASDGIEPRRHLVFEQGHGGPPPLTARRPRGLVAAPRTSRASTCWAHRRSRWAAGVASESRSARL